MQDSDGEQKFLAIVATRESVELSADAIKAQLKLKNPGFSQEIDVVASDANVAFVVTMGAEL